MAGRDKGSFICPECGSREAETVAMVSTDPEPTNPWSMVLQIQTCGACGYGIPAHLAERWNGLSVEEARTQWLQTYRNVRDR